MRAMTRFSVLDSVAVLEGSDVRGALIESAKFAAHAEALGFHRYWVSEHHGMPVVASAATSVVMAHIGQATSTIRVGSGGIMLPTHAPLAIAEQFGTLAALFPGRIDLGLGRAPGSDQRVANALRRTLAGGPDRFPHDVLELQAYFAGDERLGFEAVPGAGAEVEMWILGSSLYGAQLAAALGLPYAFASHFSPMAMDEAIATYRREFRPSERLQRPYVMAGYNVYGADTVEEARLIATSMQQSLANLHSGRMVKLPPPLAGFNERLPSHVAAMADDKLGSTSIGTQEDIERGMAAFIERTGADELIINGQIYDFEARKRSLEIAMAAARAVSSDLTTA